MNKSIWKSVGESGRVLESLREFERVWETLEEFGRLWDRVLGSLGKF